jgi:hypothetical protein
VGQLSSGVAPCCRGGPRLTREQHLSADCVLSEPLEVSVISID